MKLTKNNNASYLKGYDYGSLSYFVIVKNKLLVNKIEEKNWVEILSRKKDIKKITTR